MGNILVTIDEIEKVPHPYIWRRPLGAPANKVSRF